MNLRDAFPHPYTLNNARSWIDACSRTATSMPTTFVVDVGGAAVGGIGLRPQADIERCAAELGYWLGEKYWGRGITTAAVCAISEYAFRRLGLARVYALPFRRNLASLRVLEKAGFLREGVIRSAVIKTANS